MIDSYIGFGHSITYNTIKLTLIAVPIIFLVVKDQFGKFPCFLLRAVNHRHPSNRRKQGNKLNWSLITDTHPIEKTENYLVPNILGVAMGNQVLEILEKLTSYRG